MGGTLKRFIGISIIGRHVKRPGFVLLRFARDSDTGGTFLINPILTLSVAEMKRDGISRALSELRSMPAISPSKMGSGSAPSSKVVSKVKRDHELVQLVLLGDESEVLEIVPLHSRHGWRFDVNPEEIRTVRLPLSNEEFIRILDDVFEIAT